MLGILEQFQLGFGKHPNEPDNNLVVYIENDLDLQFKLYVQLNLERIQSIFSDYGLEFIYLTDYVNKVSDVDFQKSAKYNLPWLKPNDINLLRSACAININELQSKLVPKDASGAIIGSKGQFFKIDVHDPQLYEGQFRKIAEAYGHKVEPDNHVLFRSVPRDDDWPTLRDEPAEYHSVPVESPRQPSTTPTSTAIDPLMRLFNQVRGVVPDWRLWEVLTNELHQEEVISRLEISYKKCLKLLDYNIEIRLSPVEIAFYILFLKHPEGVRLTHLINYRRELIRYYSNYCTNANDNFEDAIDNLIDTQTNNTANINRSRIQAKINRSFRNAFCEAYSRYYTISGERDEPKKILLPRDKVVWNIDI